jgi:hypothetical protein
MGKMAATDGICGVCFKTGRVRAIERQQNGVVMQAIHGDGTTHNWLKYDSLLLNCRKARTKPDTLTCPKCGKVGKVNQYRPDNKYPLKTVYVIRHEKLSGKWGRESKVDKVRRCYITDQADKEIIDGKLGRSIPSTL